MRESRTVRAAVAGATFLIALAVNCATLAPAVFLVDSGPLTVAAWSLGNAHPPGFPLFLTVTHLTLALPFATVAWKANLVSAVFAAGASAAVALAVGELLAGRGLRIAAVAGSMLFAGLTLTFSRTLWAYATVTEVYALNTFLMASIVWLLLRWRRTRSTPTFLIVAVLSGLALGVHHVTAGLTLIALAILVIATGGAAFLRSRAFALAILCGAVTTVAVYSYLPLAARRDPALNWGDPDTVRKVVRHVTARQYRSYVRADATEEQGADIMRVLGRELGPASFPVALIAAGAGLFILFRTDRTLLWTLIAIIALCCAWLAIYPIADDEDAYLLPAVLALVIASGLAVGTAARNRAYLVLIALIVPLIAARSHWAERDRSDFQVSRDYAMNALRGVKRDAVLLTADRNLWGGLLYVTEVERVRPDVTVLMYPLLIRSWYVEQLERRRPGLMRSVAPELAAYKPMLVAFEEDRSGWSADTFQERLDDLIVAVVDRSPAAYITTEIPASDAEVDRRLIARVQVGRDLVPGGLALEVMRGKRPRAIEAVPLELRGLRDSHVEIVRREIVPAYVRALRLRARYLAATGQRAAAAESERLAVMIER